MHLTRRTWISAAGAAAAGERTDESSPFRPATEMVAALRARKVSSLELTKSAFQRIDRFHPQLNAVILKLEEEALARAKAADESIAKGRPLGPLHGLPLTVKESFEIIGTPCTWGHKEALGAKSRVNAVAVQRWLDAGAVVLGKTNVPVDLMDWQCNNPIWGRTNNPWDLERTPGGSTGGGAAALAAGMGYLALGSDIGGSIRVPAAFCGLYGHKPTLNLVPMHGHTPVAGTAGISPVHDLAVCGPLARSAADLRLALMACAGPDPDEAVALKWTLPAPRQKRLQDYRIGYVLDDPACRVTSEVGEVMEDALSRLSKAGAKLEKGWPAGIVPREQQFSYFFLMTAINAMGIPPEQSEAARKIPGAEREPFLASRFQPHRVWMQASMQRLYARHLWQEYFRSHDVFLTPTAFAPAFRHRPQDSQERLPTPEGPRDYMDMIYYVGAATFAGLPATSAPAGRTKGGLPVGLQIVGPYMEDGTTIAFAEHLVSLLGGFQEPPGRWSE